MEIQPTINALVHYRKNYTRENSFIALQIWERHQCQLLREILGDVVPLSIFDVHEGVAEVYYHEDITKMWSRLILAKVDSDPQFIFESMRGFALLLDRLEVFWQRTQLDSVAELQELFELATHAWVGVSISYFLPSMQSFSQEIHDVGMTLRERSVDFLERTDHLIQATLQGLFPELSDLVKYFTIEEVESGVLPAEAVLLERQVHFVYFGFELITGCEVDEIARRNTILIDREMVSEGLTEAQGQVAMGGCVRGVVRVLRKKSEIPLLEPGEILITAMTTPDYVPAMQQAAAFVTDEGGITCHAAIVAREFGKPCIVGTRIATQIFCDGDMVEVDAVRGVIRKLS
jgi:phosphohistidine swiveling domain-containing protein